MDWPGRQDRRRRPERAENGLTSAPATEYLAAIASFRSERWKPDYVDAPDWPVRNRRRRGDRSQLRASPGFVSIGAGCRVGAEAILDNTILWPGAQIASRSHLRNCIVRSHRKTEGELSDTDI